ncbi:hypothetical protein DQ239_04835 [Blastococcus sp. TF02-09]|uniref:thymidylate synthase n=1 Tax=Blastococcus sp. TF02-09 TaxID=2250576 RepID=UPI000DEA97C5|nr:thymidylate synthase [Blastococcus sp. TF02-9]RBY80377.1 hypothetical protein DQ239_04835 [Blastococcus sp. TF02-9]
MAPRSDAQAYRQALASVLEGSAVESVRDPLSIASNFGIGDRPSLEVLAQSLDVKESPLALLQPASVQISAPYCIGLLAWSLDGRQDVGSLEFYRSGARNFADDAGILCGAFGRRLLKLGGPDGQLSSVLGRLSEDPASRRTWLPIAIPEDNVNTSREYPCASGIQLFRRGEELHFLTVMRAQHALTVLPYDLFLFRGIHSAIAGMLNLKVGEYVHFSGTLHIYQAEVDLAQRVMHEAVQTLEFPNFPRGPGARACIRRLIGVEAETRRAIQVGNTAELKRILMAEEAWPLIDVCKRILVEAGLRRLSTASTDPQSWPDELAPGG